MPDFPQDKFTLFSNFNKSKIQGKEDEYWAKAEWPISEIRALYEYATDPSTKKRPNQRGEECVIVSQKLLPRIAKGSGNSYLMGVTSDQKELNNSSQKLPF
jgi:hypothetical protein